MDVFNFTSQLKFDSPFEILNVCLKTFGNDNTRLEGAQVHCGCGWAGAEGVIAHAPANDSTLAAQIVVEKKGRLMIFGVSTALQPVDYCKRGRSVALEECKTGCDTMEARNAGGSSSTHSRYSTGDGNPHLQNDNNCE